MKYKEWDRVAKRSKGADKKKWEKNIVSEAGEAVASQHMQTLYKLLTKALCNERPRQTTEVLDNNRKLVSRKGEVLKR